MSAYLDPLPDHLALFAATLPQRGFMLLEDRSEPGFRLIRWSNGPLEFEFYGERNVWVMNLGFPAVPGMMGTSSNGTPYRLSWSAGELAEWLGDGFRDHKGVGTSPEQAAWFGRHLDQVQAALAAADSGGLVRRLRQIRAARRGF